MNKQELLDRINENLVFALKMVPAAESQLPRMDVASTLAFVKQVQADLVQLEAMK